jgi:hypothetical protein
MDPHGFMHLQAFLLALSLIGLALGAPVIALAICGVLLVEWLAVDSAYARTLKGRDRLAGRARGDREVARQAGLIIALPAAVAGGTAVVSFRAWHASAATVGGAFLTAFWLATYASSVIDWYYVRPRRDGVVVEPPCRTSGRASWTGLTRIWLAHRSVAVIVMFVCAVGAWIAFGILVSGSTPKKDEVAFATLILTGLGVGAAAVKPFAHSSSLGVAITSCVFASPDIALGDKILGPDSFVGGFVRDVGLEGVTLVRLAPDGGPLRDADGFARTKRHGLSDLLSNPSERPFALAPPRTLEVAPLRVGCCWC